MSELIINTREKTGGKKSQTAAGCKHRVGNSLGSVSKITKVGLAKRKEKKEAKR